MIHLFLLVNLELIGWNKTTSNYKNLSIKIQWDYYILIILNALAINDTTHIISGQWNISRLDSSKNVGGYYSLIWIKKEDGWRIVYDHTS